LLFGLFDNSPVLDPASEQWLFDASAWALENFDAGLFYNDTSLIIPSNDFFPGRADSAEEMAALMLDKVKHYAGISHWPTHVVAHGTEGVGESPKVEILGDLRGPGGIAHRAPASSDSLPIYYVPEQVSNPEGMIAGFAHTLAHYMAQFSTTEPPGGREHWPHATEFLAIFLGFGVMVTNSAYTFRGGCGSCYNPAAVREAFLSEVEATYALAIFASLKNIPVGEVTRHLKKHLRGTYKKAVKNIQQRGNDLVRLQAYA